MPVGLGVGIRGAIHTNKSFWVVLKYQHLVLRVDGRFSTRITLVAVQHVGRLAFFAELTIICTNFAAFCFAFFAVSCCSAEKTFFANADEGARVSLGTPVFV